MCLCLLNATASVGRKILMGFLFTGIFITTTPVVQGQEKTPVPRNQLSPKEESKKDKPLDDLKDRKEPRKLLHCDEFEYEVKQDEIDKNPAFITQEKWQAVKAINTGRNAAGYIYTVDRIPGYKGKFPGHNSKRVLAIEAPPGKFQTQTSLHLQLGDANGPPNQIPGDVWFQFWIYLNYYDDPEDKEDQLSGITGGKFLYPSVDGRYPAHPLWLFTIHHHSYVFPMGEKAPRELEAKSYQETFLQTESTSPEGPYANIKKGPDYNRWKMGQTNIDERIVANRWILVKLRFDTSTTSAKYTRPGYGRSAARR